MLSQATSNGLPSLRFTIQNILLPHLSPLGMTITEVLRSVFASLVHISL
jgi:hypothetical protein